MMNVDVTSVLLGFCVGVFLGVFFFGGLAYGIRLALRSARPAVVLLLGSLCRISLLLASGYALVAVRGNAWPLVGYVFAFFLVRLLATCWARSASESESESESISAHREPAACR